MHTRTWSRSAHMSSRSSAAVPDRKRGPGRGALALAVVRVASTCSGTAQCLGLCECDCVCVCACMIQHLLDFSHHPLLQISLSIFRYFYALCAYDVRILLLALNPGALEKNTSKIWKSMLLPALALPPLAMLHDQRAEGPR